MTTPRLVLLYPLCAGALSLIFIAANRNPPFVEPVKKSTAAACRKPDSTAAVV